MEWVIKQDAGGAECNTGEGSDTEDGGQYTL